MTGTQTHDDEDALDEVVMAVDWKGKGPIGCCYYVAREETLYFMGEVQLGGTEIIDQRAQLMEIARHD